MRISWMSVVTLAGTLGLLTAAAKAADSDVAASGLASVSALKPADTCLVGLVLETQPGWHIYWKNSGDAGIATEVKWSAPPGWKVTPLEMPVPERFVSPGPIVSYGYTGQVVLLARVTAPADAAAPATITADASWLCCQDACVPGGKKIDITVPIGSSTSPDHQPLFTAAQAAIPANQPPEGVTTSATAAASSIRGDAVVKIAVHSPSALAQLAMYPASEKVQIVTPPDAAPSTASAAARSASPAELAATVHMMPSQKDPTHVPFLLVYSDHGQRLGFFVNVDLSAASAKK